MHRHHTLPALSLLLAKTLGQLCDLLGAGSENRNGHPRRGDGLEADSTASSRLSDTAPGESDECGPLAGDTCSFVAAYSDEGISLLSEETTGAGGGHFRRPARRRGFLADRGLRSGLGDPGQRSQGGKYAARGLHPERRRVRGAQPTEPTIARAGLSQADPHRAFRETAQDQSERLRAGMRVADVHGRESKREHLLPADVVYARLAWSSR